MLTGTIINSLTILCGSLLGLAIQTVTRRSAKDISADSIGGRLQAIVMEGMALCVIYIGVSGSLKGQNTLTAIISIAIGAIIGELLDLDRRMRTLGDWVQEKTARLVLRRRDGHCRLTGKRAYRELRHPESQIRDRWDYCHCVCLLFGRWRGVFCRSHLSLSGSDLSGGGPAVPPAQ